MVFRMKGEFPMQALYHLVMVCSSPSVQFHVLIEPLMCVSQKAVLPFVPLIMRCTRVWRVQPLCIGLVWHLVGHAVGTYMVLCHLQHIHCGAPIVAAPVIPYNECMCAMHGASNEICSRHKSVWYQCHVKAVKYP